MNSNKQKEVNSDPVRLVCERRGRGAVVRVYVALADTEYEALKLDALEHAPHYHLDPNGRNIVKPIRDPEPMRWIIRMVRGDLRNLLTVSGFGDVANQLDDRVIEVQVKQIEQFMKSW